MARGGSSNELTEVMDFYHNMCGDVVADRFPTPKNSAPDLTPSDGSSSNNNSSPSTPSVLPPHQQPSTMTATATNQTSSLLADASVDERLSRVIRCARSAGFDSLDAVLATYYTARFDERGACATAQRLSRIRRLPELLEKLRAGAEAWPRWEARVYRDEVVKSAERVLAAEARDLRRCRALRKDGANKAVALEEDMDRVHFELQDAVSLQKPKSHPRILPPILTQRLMQAPNLWSVITTLLHGPGNELCSDYSLRLVRIISLLCV